MFENIHCANANIARMIGNMSKFAHKGCHHKFVINLSVVQTAKRAYYLALKGLSV